MTTEAKAKRALEPITYSALATFRNCRKRFYWRYVRELAPIQKDPALRFGTLWHSCTERLDNGADLPAVMAFVDESLPERATDREQRKFWHLLNAMLAAYVRKYSNQADQIVAAEKKFEHPIFNPKTGAPSKTFVMAGKVDLIFERDGKRYIRERKTAANIDQSYIERLWTDFQSQLYAYFIEQAEGVKIYGVEYDVVVKAKLQQSEGETEEEFKVRFEEACKKNKSGKSSATRQLPESDEDFAKRLAEKYQDPQLLHREPLLFSKDDLDELRSDLWELTQAILEARRRNAWYKNTSQCWAYNKPCPYFALCRSNGNPILIENQYEHRPAHEELVDESSSIEQPTF